MGLFRKSPPKKAGLPPPPPPYVPAREVQPSAEAPQTPPVQAPRMEAPKLEVPQHAEEHLEIPTIRAQAQRVVEPQEMQPESVDPTVHRPRMLDAPNPAPLFVGVSDYETILEGVDSIKHGLGETEGHVAKILELKQQQERTIDDWRHHLEEIQKKLTYVDEVIFRAK